MDIVAEDDPIIKIDFSHLLINTNKPFDDVMEMSSSGEDEDEIEMSIDSDGFDEEKVNDLQTRFQACLDTMPVAPTSISKQEYKYDFHLFYYLKTKLYYYIFNKPDAPRPGMTDDSMLQTAQALHMIHFHREFLDYYEQIRSTILDKVIRDVLHRTNNDSNHPMAQVMYHIANNKELHCRRIKASPSKVRNKLSVGERPDEVYNVVTLEKCEFGDKPSTLKWMIINPLPSDYDENALDPQEGGRDFKLAIFADQLQHNVDPAYNIGQPFGFVVTPEWETFLSFIHNIAFFDEYVDALITKRMSAVKNHIDKSTWNSAWKSLVTEEYYDKNITQFSSNNSKPAIVSTICKIRDLFRTIMSFYFNLSSV